AHSRVDQPGSDPGRSIGGRLARTHDPRSSSPARPQGVRRTGLHALGLVDHRDHARTAPEGGLGHHLHHQAGDGPAVPSARRQPSPGQLQPLAHGRRRQTVHRQHHKCASLRSVHLLPQDRAGRPRANPRRGGPAQRGHHPAAQVKLTPNSKGLFSSLHT
ncbi:uncharacterized protein ACA1_099940, partial [Acanthamoeba castellanii str. Neff]